MLIDSQLSNLTLRLFNNDLLCINGRNFEVHAVNGGEDVGRPLHHALAGLGHGNGGAPRQKDGLVSRTEGKNAGKATLDQNNLKLKLIN